MRKNLSQQCGIEQRFPANLAHLRNSILDEHILQSKDFVRRIRLKSDLRRGEHDQGIPARRRTNKSDLRSRIGMNAKVKKPCAAQTGFIFKSQQVWPRQSGDKGTLDELSISADLQGNGCPNISTQPIRSCDTKGLRTAQRGEHRSSSQPGMIGQIHDP